MLKHAEQLAFPSDMSDGMSLRDYFAGQALSNPAICTGTAPEYYLKAWFSGRCAITSFEIAAAQAQRYADAMLAERAKGSALPSQEHNTSEGA